jgi:hypothetical protein
VGVLPPQTQHMLVLVMLVLVLVLVLVVMMEASIGKEAMAIMVVVVVAAASGSAATRIVAAVRVGARLPPQTCWHYSGCCGLDKCPTTLLQHVED